MKEWYCELCLVEIINTWPVWKRLDVIPSHLIDAYSLVKRQNHPRFCSKGLSYETFLRLLSDQLKNKITSLSIIINFELIISVYLYQIVVYINHMNVYLYTFKVIMIV